MYRLHHILAFTAIPGVALRDHIHADRAVRLSEPSSAKPPCSWLDVIANNAGFFSPYEYPCQGVAGNASPFVIGVFGGSAAHWFALQVGSALAEELDRGGEVQRQALVLNFAIGGMKQPQTLFTLTWSLTDGQRFDAVVLIDGFNDAALSYLNYRKGYRSTAPSIQHLERLTDVLAPYKPTMGMAESEREVPRLIAEHWARSTRIMHDLCRSRRIPIVHLVQPNQYYSRKSFSLDEERYALSGSSPYREGVEVVYPLIVEQAARLARDGYCVINAVSAYDDITDTVYSDNCCHFNLRGNLVLKDIVLAQLMAGPSLAPSEVTSPDLRKPAVQSQPIASTPRPETSNDEIYPMW